jgi:transcriptional regulator with AAA-type ATPase domain
LEFEHHLVPREERLLAWAHMAAQRASRPAALEPAKARIPEQDADAKLFGELVEHLGLRGPQRRWWGFRVRAGRTEVAAEGGDAASAAPDRPAGQALLGRVRLAGGHLGFEGPDRALALRSNSMSGIALALRSGGRVLGILAVESLRPKDFQLVDLVRHESLLATAALRLRTDAFRALHREHYGEDLWFHVDSLDFQAFCERFLRAAESDCTALIAGPPGCGKSVLARWMHAESARASSALFELRPGCLSSDSAWRATLARARGATLLLEDADRLEAAAAERLVGWLDARPAEHAGQARPRLLATATALPDGSVREVANGPALGRYLDPIRFDMPSLRARRAEIVPLVACLAERHAGEEGLRVPSFDDDALALLWRQPWEGNVRELAGVVHRAVLFAPGRTITCPDLEALAVRFGRPLVRRLPSRHPARSDLLTALQSTLLGTGRVNKTRAAAYLGWDPDTLVARLADLRLDAHPLPVEGDWDRCSRAAPQPADSVSPEDSSSAG